jgi:hypothetical protein
MALTIELDAATYILNEAISNLEDDLVASDRHARLQDISNQLGAK